MLEVLSDRNGGTGKNSMKFNHRDTEVPEKYKLFKDFNLSVSVPQWFI